MGKKYRSRVPPEVKAQIVAEYRNLPRVPVINCRKGYRSKVVKGQLDAFVEKWQITKNYLFKIAYKKQTWYRPERLL